jgi:hypothetical protein
MTTELRRSGDVEEEGEAVEERKTIIFTETSPLGELASRANESARCVKIKVSSSPIALT